MKTKRFMIAGLLAVASVTGCAGQAPTFSWYHPSGGEFLFAYDMNECESAVTAGGSHLGTEIGGPFFQCMHERGYYLVDGERIVQAPATEALAMDQQVSQQ